MILAKGNIVLLAVLLTASSSVGLIQMPSTPLIGPVAANFGYVGLDEASEVASEFGAEGLPQWNDYPLPSTVRNHDGAAEPTIGIKWVEDAADPLFFKTRYGVGRAVFDDSTPGVKPPVSWSDVSPVIGVVNPEGAWVVVDPIIHVDEVDGRMYAGHMRFPSPCGNMRYSDDEGQSWQEMLLTCSINAGDHQTVGSGPWADPVPTEATLLGGERAVYYCAQYPGIAGCGVSYDGGITFTEQQTVPCQSFQGHVVVSPEGYVAVPNRACGGGSGFSFSTNNGQSWVARGIPGSGGGQMDPSVGFSRNPDSQGKTLTYLAQALPTGAFIGISNDFGVSWLNIDTDSSPTWLNIGKFHDPPITGAEFINVQVGDADRAAVTFLGLTSGTNSGTCPGPASNVWHAYAAMTYDRGATWTVQRISEHPVQIGSIFTGGLQATGDSSCRNLLEFNDMDIDDQGRVHFGFADGCPGTGNCGVGNRAEKGTVIRQSTGRGLFAAFDVGDDPDSPILTIDSHADDDEVDAGTITISGTAKFGTSGTALSAQTGDYTGAVNTPIAISGSASGGQSSQGYSCSWTGTSGTIADDELCSTTVTFSTTGTYTLTLTVDDGDSEATAEAEVVVSAAQLPTPDPNYQGSFFAYNIGAVCIGVSNVIAIATEAAGDPVPKYPGGTDACISARNVGDGTCSLIGQTGGLALFNEQAERVYIEQGIAIAQDEDLTGVPSGCHLSGDPMVLPLAEGRYYLAAFYDLAAGRTWITSDAGDPTGLKPLDVIGIPSAPTAGLPIAAPASCSTMTCLYMVGDGSQTVATEPVSLVTNFELSSQGHGNLGTTYTTIGSWNSDANENAFVPTFIGDETVTIGATSAVRVFAYVDYSMPLAGVCPLWAQVFDDAGSILGPVGGVENSGAGGGTGIAGPFQELVFDFTGKIPAGTYGGLKVQMGPTGVDCGTAPSTWAWGTDATPGRIEISGQAPPDADSDGVPDASDNCPNNANANQLNTDGDAQGDACDADDDNDGISDGSDACPLLAGPGPSGCPISGGERVILSTGSQTVDAAITGESWSGQLDLSNAGDSEVTITAMWVDDNNDPLAADSVTLFVRSTGQTGPQILITSPTDGDPVDESATSLVVSGSFDPEADLEQGVSQSGLSIGWQSDGNGDYVFIDSPAAGTLMTGTQRLDGRAGNSETDPNCQIDCEDEGFEFGAPTSNQLRPGDLSEVCTLNFVYEYEGRYFFGSAAHCAATGSNTDTNGCLVPSQDIGTPETLTNGNGLTITATLAYSSWQTMQSVNESNSAACAGNDFALFEIKEADVSKIHPAVRMYGGPTSLGQISDMAQGDELRAYGRSFLHDDTILLDPEESLANPKNGVYLGQANGGWSYFVYLAVPGIPGDSGGGLMAIDGAALGAASTIGLTPYPASNNYANIARALEYMQEKKGWAPKLVTWDDFTPDPHVSMVTGNSGSLPESNLPDGINLGVAGPGSVAETFYVHNSGCGGAGTVWLDHTPAAGEEAGNGCGGLNSLDGSWTADEGTDEAYPVGSTIKVYIRGFTLAPHPSVSFQGTLAGNAGTVATGTSTAAPSLSLALVTTPCSEWVIEAQTTAPIAKDDILTLSIDAPQDVQGAFCYEGGTDSFRIELEGEGVEVADVTITVNGEAAGSAPVTDGEWSHSINFANFDVDENGDYVVVATYGTATETRIFSGEIVVPDECDTLAGKIRVTFANQEACEVYNPAQAGTWNTLVEGVSLSSGTYAVTATAYDAAGDPLDSHSIDVVVGEVPNRAPTAAAGPDQSVDEGSTVTLSAAASSDPDGDTLTYQWTAPSGITLSSTTAVAPTFTAPNVDADTQLTFTLTVSDGELSSTADSVRVLVRNVEVPNGDPELDPIGAKSVVEGSLLSFLVTASDPDGDTVLISASNLPSGAGFTGSRFSWRPTTTQAGTYQVTFTADDQNGATDEEVVTITVTENGGGDDGGGELTIQPVAPEIRTLTPDLAEYYRGETVSVGGRLFDGNGANGLQVTATWGKGAELTDVDSNDIQVVADAQNNGFATLDFTFALPADAELGGYVITVTVKDPTDRTDVDTRTFAIVLPVEPLALGYTTGTSLQFGGDVAPGAQGVESTNQLTIKNQHDDAFDVAFDMTDFVRTNGPQRIKAVNNIMLIVDADGSGPGEAEELLMDATSVVLGSVAPGETMTVGIRILKLPNVLPQDSYRATFSVVEDL